MGDVCHRSRALTGFLGVVKELVRISGRPLYI